MHRVLNRLHWVPNVALGLALYAWGGFGLVVWGLLLRLVLTVNGTWFVNSAAHTWGYRTWQTKEDSRNLWWVGLSPGARAGTTRTTRSSARRATASAASST